MDLTNHHVDSVFQYRYDALLDKDAFFEETDPRIVAYDEKEAQKIEEDHERLGLDPYVDNRPDSID